MKKFVMSSFLAAVAVFALLGSASAATISSAIDEAVAAVNVQMDTVAFDVAHCGTCGMGGDHGMKAKASCSCGGHDKMAGSCGCKDKCGSKCKGCGTPNCNKCKPKCKSKCGGCKDKCGCSKPKCGCKKDKCGCSKPKCESKCKSSCGCKTKCCKTKCCPKQVENYPDANRGAEGDWARDGLSRQRA